MGGGAEEEAAPEPKAAPGATEETLGTVEKEEAPGAVEETLGAGEDEVAEGRWPWPQTNPGRWSWLADSGCHCAFASSAATRMLSLTLSMFDKLPYPA